MDKRFESWACQKNLIQLVRRLERDSFLEQLPGNDRDRIYRITPQGWEGVWRTNPETRWNTPWDNEWRIVLFDLPRENNKARKSLLNALRTRGFGCLQGSVWISPFPFSDLKSSISKGELFASSLLCLEGRPAGHEKDSDLVLGAWDWDEIQRRWKQFHQSLKGYGTFDRRGKSAENAETRLKEILRSWHQIVALDPFLPKSLLPSFYPGLRVWKKCNRILQSSRPPSGLH